MTHLRLCAGRADDDVKCRAKQRRADEQRDRVDHAERGERSGGERIGLAKQLCKPDRCQRLERRDTELECDADASQTFMLYEVRQRTRRVALSAQLRPNDHESHPAAESEAQIEKAGQGAIAPESGRSGHRSSPCAASLTPLVSHTV